MNNNSDLIYMIMYKNLRERTGKQFVKKYFGGGPIAPGKFVGDIEAGTDGNLYKWNGSSWMPLSITPSQNMGIDPFKVETNNLASPIDLEVKSEFDTDYENWNTANSTLADAKEERRSIERDDYKTFGEYRQARKDATAAVREARQDKMEAGLTIGGGQARRDARKERIAQRAKERELRQAERAANTALFAAATGLGGSADGTVSSAVGNFINGNFGTGAIDLAVAGMHAIDSLAMGDKNFSAQSEAIDDAVQGVSGALLKSGNPYAMLAGVALEGTNFLSKAGGLTVQGFDVDINSSGYGTLGHQESSSSRALPFLGGLADAGKILRKLTLRNEQAQMAMNAANIANEQKFEQEARMNSIQNTIMNNQMALSGGMDTSLLGG